MSASFAIFATLAIFTSSASAAKFIMPRPAFTSALTTFFNPTWMGSSFSIIFINKKVVLRTTIEAGKRTFFLTFPNYR